MENDIQLQAADGVAGQRVSRPSTDHSSPRFPSASFISLALGQFISMVGNAVYSLALMWEMKVLTGSTLMMSTILVASLIPLLVFGPIAGVLVDRWKKKTAMIYSDVLRGLVIGLLTILLATHHIAPWMLVAGSVLNSTIGSVFNPAESTLVPLLVGKDKVQQANSITQGAMVISQLIGPFLGGILVGHVSMVAAFSVNSLSFFLSVVSLLFVKSPEPERVHSPLNMKRMGFEVKEGLDVIRSIDVLRAAIPIALITNFLFAPVDLILIQFCTTVLHGGAQLYGLFGTFFAAGMLAGALLAGILATKVRRGILIASSFPVMALAMLALSFTRIIWVAMALAVICGLSNMVLNILFQSIVQVQIPTDKMGRVFGAIGILFQGAQPFAQLSTGFLLSIVSVPVLLGILGVLQVINSAFAASNRVIRAQQ